MPFADNLWHVKHKLYETGALIADLRPENLQFQLNREPPHTIQYELSLSRPEVEHDFVGPYRTFFELWHGNDGILAGPHTHMDVGLEDDFCTVQGKDWFHLLERTQYPFDPRPDPPYTPSHVNDYVIGSPAQGFAYETASTDVTDVLAAIFDVAVGMIPKHFQFTYPTLAANLGIPVNFSLGLADSTSLADIIGQLADSYPGFVYEMLFERELRLYSPHKYNEDAGNLALTIAQRKAACNYAIDSTNMQGVEELHFANEGPAATHLFGKGPGLNQSNYGSALGYAPAQAIYGRLDDTVDFQEVPNRTEVISRNRKRFNAMVNPQHEITLKMNPDRIPNFWTLIQPGYALWLDVDLIAHQIQSAQEIVNMNCSVTNEGDASVDFGLEQVYSGTTGVEEG